MKKIFTVFVIFLLAGGISVFAQDFAKKGNVELGSGLGFTSTTGVFDGTSASESVSTFWFYPYVGYFVINNVELGLIPRFSTSSYGDQSNTSFGILFAPAYNFDLHSSVYPFIEGRIGYNSSSYDDGNSETDDPSSSGLEWGFRGGIKAQVAHGALVNAGIFYEQVTMNPENWNGGRNGSNQFGIELGFTVFINTK